MAMLEARPKERTASADHMAQSNPAPRLARSRAAARATEPVAAAPARVEHRITVPAEVSMVELLGLRDEVLRAVESGFPTVDVHIRGNQVRMVGPVGDVALVARLVA